MLVLGITVPVATFLSRRFSVRQHVFIALAFFLVGALADLFAPNFGVLLAGRVFQAISTGHAHAPHADHRHDALPARSSGHGHGRGRHRDGLRAEHRSHHRRGDELLAGMAQLLCAARGHHVALAAAAAVAIKPSAAPDKSARLDVVSLAQSTLGFGGLLLAFSNASSFSFESPFIWLRLC